MNIEMIVAVDLNNGISKNGIIPWIIQEDIKFFKEKTINNIVLMGSKTYFSIPIYNRPLKNRLNVVLTKTPEIYDILQSSNKNLLFTNDEDYIKTLSEKYYDKTIFIIGGSMIYNSYYDMCDVIWITFLKHNYNCDKFLDIKNILKNYVLDEIVKENDIFTINKYVKILV